MAAGYPALCKQGKSKTVPSFRPFNSSASTPRLFCVLVLISLSLLPVGWSSGVVVRSAGTSGSLGGGLSDSPQLLAYRPQKTEQGTTDNGAFVFRKFHKLSSKIM